MIKNHILGKRKRKRREYKGEGWDILMWHMNDKISTSSGQHHCLDMASLMMHPPSSLSSSSSSSSASSLWLRKERGNGLSKAPLKIESVVKRSPKRLKYYFSQKNKASKVLYLQVDPSGSDEWKLEPVIKLLKDGGVGIIPTDTIYAIVCDLKNRIAVDRIYRIKDMDPKKPLSILCRSFQDIDFYTLGFPSGSSEGQTNIFRAARQCFPGPYTFILPTSKEMPKQCTNFGGSILSCAPRKSVGVRMPRDQICQAILSRLDGPLICTSVRRRADDEWMLDPVIIADTYGVSVGKEGVDFVVDGGVRVADPSTVVDMTTKNPVLLRQGKGLVEDWMMTGNSESLEAKSDGLVLNPYA